MKEGRRSSPVLDVRYYLNGLMLETADGVLRAVATDGHRLSKSEALLDSNQTPDKHQIISQRKYHPSS